MPYNELYYTRLHAHVVQTFFYKCEHFSNVRVLASFRSSTSGAVSNDRKYDDYCERGIRFVSRLKDNAVIEEVYKLPKSEGTKTNRDVKVILGKGKKQIKNALRMIEPIDSHGNPIRIITNRFDLTAEEIGEMYRSRWQIEIFFR